MEIPDFDIATQGMDIADAMEMARDAIGLMGIDLMDEGKVLPEPNIAGINAAKEDIVTLVDSSFFCFYIHPVWNRTIFLCGDPGF